MSFAKPVVSHAVERDLFDFSNEELQAFFAGDLVGKKIILVESIDSTNTFAAKLACGGALSGTAVIADCQTGGKGRLQRVWQSPPGSNIYTSVILKPDIPPMRAPQLTLAAGVAVADVLSQYCTGRVTLKWPNDIQIGGKKICGILTEMRTTGGMIDYIIVGIGININIATDEFDEEIRQRATSLAVETGERVSRVDFTVKLYQSLEKWYDRYLDEGFSPIKNRWLGYSEMLNRDIQVSFRGKTETGKGLGIDDHGALLLFDEEKNIKHIIAGDVSLIGES